MGIISQIFGILGLLFSVLSYQEKNNKKFLIIQGISGFMFFMNFILIGAVSAALFNLVNLVRGIIFSKEEKKKTGMYIVTALYVICFAISLVTIISKPFKIFLSSFTFLTLLLMTFLMWRGNPKHIRYGQLFASSPSWLIHNIFNFSLGGILCEVFTIVSVIISFIRFGKELTK